MEKQNPALCLRAHTIVVLNLEEGPRSATPGKVASRLYFVDLAGSGIVQSEIGVERYGKGRGDNEKYRESMSIATELKSLERAFLSLPNEGVLPKETILMVALRSLLQQQSDITLIGHIVSSNFEESLSTLQYVERCKAEMVGGERGTGVEGLGTAGSDQLMRNLRQVNDEYKKEIESVERKNEAQFDRIKSTLGIDVDLKAMLKRGPTQAERVILEKHRQARERVKNFQDRNVEITAKLRKAKASIEKIKQKIDDKSYYFTKLLSGLNSELEKLMKQSTKLKNDYNSIPTEMAGRIEEQRRAKAEIAAKELEQHFEVLLSAQTVLDQKSEDMAEATRIFENAKREIERKYREDTRLHQQTKAEQLASLEKQYEMAVGKCKEELRIFMAEAEKYCKSKREYNGRLKDEVHRLGMIVHTQTLAIESAELGVYTGGIRSVNIPKKERMRLPSTGRATACSQRTANGRTAAGEDAFRRTRSAQRPATSQRSKLLGFSRPQTRNMVYRSQIS